MQRISGFTLIELMITLAVIAILTAIAYPSYQDHIRRGVRAHGQQYLTDLAQREEQFFLDRRVYTNVIAPGGIDLQLPTELQNKYLAAAITLLPGPPPGYRIALAPAPGSIVATDGTLIINNLQQNFRDMNGDGTYTAGTDKLWTDR